LSAEEVLPGLKTEVFGRKDYFYYPEIDSTNQQARILASQGYPEGTVVVADAQTAGRGRRGRDWIRRRAGNLHVFGSSGRACC
jgi:BirA family biotin operon repressor/biotin-[acetyl-CoA-carboxylase] ligase